MMIYSILNLLSFVILSQSRPEKNSISDPYHLTIIHVNDIHAHFEEVSVYATRCRDGFGNCYGGVARMQTKKKQILSQDPEALFLNAGDFYQGLLLR